MATVSLTQPPTFSEVARKRRLMSRSDEEIEDNIDIRIQYRTGWPKLAHLPLRTVYEGNPDAFFPDRQTHISQIITILRAQQIPISSISVVYRVPYGGDNSNKLDETTATLLVTTFPDGDYNSFVAAREIRKYLNSHEIHVLIEIIDERALKPSVFPILPSDKELISIWNERLKQTTIDILKASCLKVISITSCGPIGGTWTGSMGGPVRLEKGGEDMGVFGLSNHHVVRSDSLEAVTENNTPLRPTHSSVKSMSFLITSQSDRDTDLILQTTEAGVDELKKVLKGRPGTLGLEAMAETGERSKAKSLEAVQDRLARAEHRALIIKDANRVLGSVSTGWTEGKVSAIETVFLKGESKYTHDVLAWPVVPLHRHKYDFAAQGDAGAVVVVSDELAVDCGCWVGLLFAANLAAGTGFFVPMSLVLKDISEITGCQVVQPSKIYF
ncbi:predicted protein [Histoplasma mississippiense (nom. inval.)]|uniref:predicted protein n=1 Tax=Ajellomyces capsulatus (strain NAm1 / WU24) TaxID=2059318 RepID=UPI000157B682|nr:predicted protein [Histoplasma mississippiense (nom. inval.)]EDN03154.1 predicted protein [Histoplasma mississippiense (nom. inval.)]